MAIIYREDLKEVSELNDNEFEIAKNRFVDERIESVIDLMSDYIFDKNGQSYHKDNIWLYIIVKVLLMSF